MEEATLDTIVDVLANGDFCASMGDERCPAIVDAVIRQGLPMLAAAGADGDFSQVLCYFKALKFNNFWLKLPTKYFRPATPLWKALAQPSSGSSE